MAGLRDAYAGADGLISHIENSAAITRFTAERDARHGVGVSEG